MKLQIRILNGKWQLSRREDNSLSLPWEFAPVKRSFSFILCRLLKDGRLCTSLLLVFGFGNITVLAVVNPLIFKCV